MLAREVMGNRCAGYASLCAAVLLCGATACHAGSFPEPVSLGDGVYVFLGACEAPSDTNRGHVANQGFIVAPTGVILIDSGANAAFAEHMLRAIRARTDRPLAGVILTRPTDDAIFGAATLQQHGATILMHAAAAQLMAERCQACLDRMTAVLGSQAMTGSRVPRPDRLFTGDQRLALGGRTLLTIDYSGAAAPGSIAVWDPASRVLFAGGLASFDRVPETRDGTLAEWVGALRDLSRRPARMVVPGHGPIGQRSRLHDVARYLSALDSRTAAAYAAHTSLLDAPRTVAIPEYQSWALYALLHPRNVHHTYLAHERRELARP